MYNTRMEQEYVLSECLKAVKIMKETIATQNETIRLVMIELELFRDQLRGKLVDVTPRERTSFWHR